MIAAGLVLLASIGVYAYSNYAEKKRVKELESNAIDVYRYRVKVYLVDGSSYIKPFDIFVTYDFDEFVGNEIYSVVSLDIDDKTVINTDSIVKVELDSVEQKKIRPIVGLVGTRDVYSLEDIKEREVVE